MKRITIHYPTVRRGVSWAQAFKRLRQGVFAISFSLFWGLGIATGLYLGILFSCFVPTEDMFLILMVCAGIWFASAPLVMLTSDDPNWPVSGSPLEILVTYLVGMLWNVVSCLLAGLSTYYGIKFFEALLSL